MNEVTSFVIAMDKRYALLFVAACLIGIVACMVMFDTVKKSIPAKDDE